MSPLQVDRTKYKPRLPPFLTRKVRLIEAPTVRMCPSAEILEQVFPNTTKVPSVQCVPHDDQSISVGSSSLRIGIVFVGRHAPGNYNIMLGLAEFLESLPQPGTLLLLVSEKSGFVEDATELTSKDLELYRNQGGLTVLSRGHRYRGKKVDAGCDARRKKCSLQSQDLQQCAATVDRLKLDGLVLVGGCDTQCTTAMTSEHFLASGLSCRVIGVPASMDSDVPLIEQTSGFDTACKVLSSILGSLATDAASSKKTYYFVRIAGQSLSHTAAECTLQVHPHLVLLPREDLVDSDFTLDEITSIVCDVIQAREQKGMSHGMVLVPDGMLGRVPEMRRLAGHIDQLTLEQPELFGAGSAWGRESLEAIIQELPDDSRFLMETLPRRIQAQIAFSKSDNGKYCHLIAVEAEHLMKALVESELSKRKAEGDYCGSFQCITHALAYQARSALPSNLDCDLAYTQGWTSGVLIQHSLTALLVSVGNIAAPREEWTVGAVQLPSIVSVDAESAKPGERPTLSVFIEPDSLVLKPEAWKARLPNPVDRQTCVPGPLQFYGPSADVLPALLQLALDVDDDLSGQERMNLLRRQRAQCADASPSSAEPTGPFRTSAKRGLRKLALSLSSGNLVELDDDPPEPDDGVSGR
jgi:pyrophosphate--fructose-6-phosphate 1-phosphotransferase